MFGILENLFLFIIDDDELEGGYVFMLFLIECLGENFLCDFYIKEYYIISLSDKENEGGNFFDSVVKCVLKKVILEMEWLEDEWMELIEIVRFKMGYVKCLKKIYVELLFFGR